VLLPSPQDVEELVGLLCESGDFDAAAALSAAFLSADLSPVGVSQPPKAKAALLSTLMANGVLPPPPASSASYGSSSSEGSDVNHGRKLLGAVVASLARACVKLQVAAQPDPSASGAAATARSDAANESGGGGGGCRDQRFAGDASPSGLSLGMGGAPWWGAADHGKRKCAFSPPSHFPARSLQSVGLSESAPGGPRPERLEL